MEDSVNNNKSGDIGGKFHIEAGNIAGHRPDGREPGSRANFSVGADGTVTDYLPKVPEYEVTMVDREDQLPEGAFKLPNGEYLVFGEGIFKDLAIALGRLAAKREAVPEAHGDDSQGCKSDKPTPEQPAGAQQRTSGSGRVDAETTYTTKDGTVVSHSVSGTVNGNVYQLSPDFKGDININRGDV